MHTKTPAEVRAANPWVWRGMAVLTWMLITESWAANDSQGVAFFENRIRPVLAEHCLRCHGEEPAKLKGGLFLTSRPGILRGGDSGPALTPGKPAESLILSALRWQGELEMPPKEKLPDSVVADFERWIAMGAPDPRLEEKVAAGAGVDLSTGRKHWAFQPLREFAPEESIDSLLGEKLRSAGIRQNPEASGRTLIRRVFLDLLGLPPNRDELSRYDATPFAQMVDELLESRHFGERWARHWLDVARFAESNGYELDGGRRGAFQYRDWVIRAFNADLPYDRFVRWQIAGDQLAPNLTDALIATGFIVAGPFSFPKPKAEITQGRYDELDDMVSTLGSAFLAQTVGCARCHDHKFEPIPQEDYYALAAAFAPTDRKRATLTPGENGALEIQLFSEKSGNKEPLPNAPAMAAYVARDFRSEPVHFLVRGDPKHAKFAATPGFLQVLPNPEAEDHGVKVHPRVALANWLTNVENGAGALVAQVIVNRLWHHHFGRGLVATPNDFGFRGAQPTHPRLLDFLATRLIENGWRLKPVHRLILTSAAWRQSSAADGRRTALDPDNRLIWRQNVRRLEAEPLRDSLLAVAGMLDRSAFGKGALSASMKRRAIYFETKRTRLTPFLQMFDAPDALTSIGKRNSATAVPQALLLLNDPMVRACAAAFASRVRAAADPLASAYELALGRLPSEIERMDGEDFIAAASLEEFCQALLISNEFFYVR